MNGNTETTTIEADFFKSSPPSRLLESYSNRANSSISKSYKQASAFFLTHRLLEAFSILEPIITPDQPSISSDHDAADTETAPIAIASRNTKTKVWNLYLTLLNAIIELGPDEGKNVFGNRKWQNIVAKVRQGSIWEEVVQAGYKGIEENVDAEVVTCLATLLLAQSSSQVRNQQRLESYLLGSNSSVLESDSLVRSLEKPSEVSAQSIIENVTSTPQSLYTRVKIIELYALHVLPRNEEWQYARDFISMSDILDEERKEAFLQALQALEAEQNTDNREDISIDDQGGKYAQGHQKADGQGFICKNPKQRSQDYEHQTNTQVQIADAKDHVLKNKSTTKAVLKCGTEAARTYTPSSHSNHARVSASARPSSTVKKSPAIGVYARGLALMAALQRSAMNMAQAVPTKPMALLKTILFLVGIVLAFGRRDLRDKISGASGIGWNKIRETVGMGVKVSYI